MKQGFCFLTGLIFVFSASIAMAEPECPKERSDCPLTVETVTAEPRTQPEALAEKPPRRILFGSKAVGKSEENSPSNTIIFSRTTEPTSSETAPETDNGPTAQDQAARDILLDAMDVPENQREDTGGLECTILYEADGTETRSCRSVKTIDLSSD